MPASMMVGVPTAGVLDPDVLMRVNRDDEVSELKLALLHARQRIRSLEAQLAYAPHTYALQDREGKARRAILVQWAKHSESCEVAWRHLCSAADVDRAVGYERAHGPVVSPHRFAAAKPATMQDIRGSLNQAMMDRCKAILALTDEDS